MKFITAISRHRIDRQRYCLKTWEQFGDITAVQTAEDIELLKPHFPNVNFVETNLTGFGLYGEGFQNRVRIKALVDQGPGLLVNSDIKIETTAKEFAEDWKPEPKQFNVGIRYDFDGPGKPKRMCGYGIDAFLITEEIMERLPDVGFVIGVSVWDHWIIWHMMTEKFRIKAKTTSGLLHLRHQQNWGEWESGIGHLIMKRHYGMKHPKQLMDAAILCATDRLNRLRLR